MPETDNQNAPPLTQQVADKAKEQTQQVKDQATQAVQQGQKQVNHLWELGRSQFHNALTGQKDRAASALGDVGQMLQQSASTMREQGQPGGSQLADSIAQKVTALSETVHGKEIEDILSDTEDFARRQPAAFLAIATLIGFIIARFLKSSGQAATAS